MSQIQRSSGRFVILAQCLRYLLLLVCTFCISFSGLAEPINEEDLEIQSLVEEIQKEAAQIIHPLPDKGKKMILVMSDSRLGHNLAYMPSIIASAAKSFPDYDIHYFGMASKVMIHNPGPGIYIHSLGEAFSFLEKLGPNDFVNFFIRNDSPDTSDGEKLKEIAQKWQRQQLSHVKVYDHSSTGLWWEPAGLGLKVENNSFEFISTYLPNFTSLPTDAEVHGLYGIPSNIVTVLEKLRRMLFSKGFAHPEWEFELINFHAITQGRVLEENLIFSINFEKLMSQRLISKTELNMIFAPFSGGGTGYLREAVQKLIKKFPGRILDLSDIQYPFVYEHLIRHTSRFITLDTGIAHYAVNLFPEKTYVLILDSRLELRERGTKADYNRRKMIIRGWEIPGGKYRFITETSPIEDIYASLYHDDNLNYFLAVLKEQNPDQISLAFDVLLRAKTPAAYQALLELKNSSNPKIREYLASQLTEIPTQEAFQILENMVKGDPAFIVRESALVSLLKLNLSEIVPSVVEAFQRQVVETLQREAKYQREVQKEGAYSERAQKRGEEIRANLFGEHVYKQLARLSIEKKYTLQLSEALSASLKIHTINFHFGNVILRLIKNFSPTLLQTQKARIVSLWLPSQPTSPLQAFLLQAGSLPPKEFIETTKVDHISNITLMLQSPYIMEGGKEVPLFLVEFIEKLEKLLDTSPNLRTELETKTKEIEQEISKMSRFEQERAKAFAEMGAGKRIMVMQGWSFGAYLTAKVLADAIKGYVLSDELSTEALHRLFSSEGFKEEVMTYVGFAGAAAIVRVGQALTFQQVMRYMTQYSAGKAFKETALLKQSAHLDKALRAAVKYGGKQLGGEISKILASGMKETFPMFFGMYVSGLITAYMQHPDWILLDDPNLEMGQRLQISVRMLYDSTIETSQKLAFWANVGVNTAEFAVAMAVIKGGVCLAKHCVAGTKWIAAVPEGAVAAPLGPLGWAGGYLLEAGELTAAMILSHLFDKVVDPLSGSLIAWLDEKDVQRQAENMGPKIQEYVTDIKKASLFKNQQESTEMCLAGLINPQKQPLAKKLAKQSVLEGKIETEIKKIIQEKLLKIALALSADESCIPAIEKIPEELRAFYQMNRERLQVQFKENLKETCKMAQMKARDMRMWYGSSSLKEDFHRMLQVYSLVEEEYGYFPLESRIKLYDQIFVALDKLDIKSQIEKAEEKERMAEFFNQPEGMKILPNQNPFNFNLEEFMKPKEQVIVFEFPKLSPEGREFFITMSQSEVTLRNLSKQLEPLMRKFFEEYSLCWSENTKEEWTPFIKTEQDFNFIGKALFINAGFKRMTKASQEKGIMIEDKTIQKWFGDKNRLSTLRGLLQRERVALAWVNGGLKPRKGEAKLPKAEGSISDFIKTRKGQINQQLELSDVALAKTLSEELFYKETPIQ